MWLRCAGVSLLRLPIQLTIQLSLYIGAVTTGANPTATPEAAEDPTTKAAAYTSRDEIVPCDCVLLRGKAVVNEASLTGMYLTYSFHVRSCCLQVFCSQQTLPECMDVFSLTPIVELFRLFR